MRNPSPGPRIYAACVLDPAGGTGSGTAGEAAGGGSGGSDEVQPATPMTTTQQLITMTPSACTRPMQRCACQPWSLPADSICPLPKTLNASAVVAVLSHLARP